MEAIALGPLVAFLFFYSSTLTMLSYAVDVNEYLEPHNEARSRVGVKPLVWDEKLESYAKDYLETLIGSCQLEHSNGPYGENLAWGSGMLSPYDAVEMWVVEKKDYDYASNSCNGQCGHYTQVVWRNSHQLGCASVNCTSSSSAGTTAYGESYGYGGSYSSGQVNSGYGGGYSSGQGNGGYVKSGGTLISCNYYPPGNYVGEKPY